MSNRERSHDATFLSRILCAGLYECAQIADLNVMYQLFRGNAAGGLTAVQPALELMATTFNAHIVDIGTDILQKLVRQRNANGASGGAGEAGVKSTKKMSYMKLEEKGKGRVG